MDSNIKKNKHWFRDIIKACWNVLNFTRQALLNLVFLFVAVIVISAILANTSSVQPIASNSVLKLNIIGKIVEQRSFVDPYNELMSDAIGNDTSSPETLLSDILYALKQAENDPNIQLVLLDLKGLFGTGLSKLTEVADALTQFKQNSNKPVIAYADYYSQSQYYLAAHADKVIMHPMGAIGIDGFGRYRMYYKSALEKLKINAHIFRVGTYKSAIEPYVRNEMSEPAKAANKQWLGDLWTEYKTNIVEARNIEVSNFDEKLNGFLSKFKEAEGDFAQFALNNSWVDALMTHQEFDQYLDKEVLNYKPKFVSLNHYLSHLSISIEQPQYADRVGIVVAKGTIYNGKRKAGEIGGESTAALLRQARLDKSVKAVVLRVDSPGGSAFASEVIRNEIEAIKLAGKPIIASMSSIAASGGYWISASADEIWASPSTITGSIGIFGMFMTFEDTLSHIGITTDGVGTTEMAGMSTTRKLNPQMAEVIQTAIEHGYEQFISLVANERGMTPEQVDDIAQGRVWSGKKAKELGLVDELGSYQQAIDAAANKAGLENFTVKVISPKLSPLDQFLYDMFNAYMPKPEQTITSNKGLIQILKQISKDLETWTQFDDPFGMYVFCMECESI